jgi:hypothetical protein
VFVEPVVTVDEGSHEVAYQRGLAGFELRREHDRDAAGCQP